MGENTYSVYTNEQQKKKSMSHAHMLAGLKDIPKTPEEVDQIISAKLPDPRNRQLYDAAKRHMIRSPCGALNHRSPCMRPV